MSLLILWILRISDDLQKLKPSSWYCFNLLACYCTCGLYDFSPCQSLLQHNYFKPVGNCNGRQQVYSSYPILLARWWRKFLYSVISVANNDIESSMRESSTKTAFYKCMRKDRISICILLCNRSLESGIFVKKPLDWESHIQI